MMVNNLLKVRRSVKGAGRAPGFIQSFCRENSVSYSVASEFCIALDEILPSIVKIATSPRIGLEIKKDGQFIEFVISHEGEQYDISNPQDIHWPVGAEDSRISELSLKIVRKLMDGIECSHMDGLNKVRLTKHLS